MRTNGINKIKATFCFNILGQLTNFTSDNRNVIGDMNKYRFSKSIKNMFKLTESIFGYYGDTIWNYPEKKS